MRRQGRKPPAKANGDFAEKIAAWQRRHGRHDLPWQGTRDPYRVWLSEIMLQQTQVATVIPYYRRFIERFPDLRSLAEAPLDDVLQHWSGLGYYSRARNLHRAANEVTAHHRGRFPRQHEIIMSLPGIGRSTAAAICVFAFGGRQAILDGNVKRILARHLGIAGRLGAPETETALWRAAEAILPRRDIKAYTQGLMDLGATVCVRAKPRCGECPVCTRCVAFGSNRTHELPVSAPKRRAPRRETDMLILLHNGDVMLEKRAPTGVWGSMWSLPEAAPGANIAALCEQSYGAEIEPLGALPLFTHRFTHFTLDIRPRRYRVTGLTPHARAPGHLWLPIEEALAAAVPAPVRRILARL